MCREKPCDTTQGARTDPGDAHSGAAEVTLAGPDAVKFTAAGHGGSLNISSRTIIFIVD